MHHNLIIKNGDATHVEKEILVDGVQFVDAEPREGSGNLITSGGVANAIGEANEAINGVVGDLEDKINAQLGPIFVSTIDGKYLSNSSLVASEFYAINTYNVEGISLLHIEARIGYTAFIWFCDKDGNKIIGYSGNNNTGINVIIDVSVPKGAVTIKVSYVKSFECVVIVPDLLNTISYISKSSLSNFRNKKIGIVGDSIAAGFISTNESKRFINVCAYQLGATVKNVAISGDKLCDNENTGVYRQVTNLDGDEKLIVIFAGTNDYGHASPIGLPYDTDSETGHRSPVTDYTTSMSGGLTKLIQDLYTKYNGYIPIIICTPINRVLKGRNSEGGSWDKNDLGLYMDDYIQGIRNVADFFGIPVFNGGDLNMNPNVASANTKYFEDGLHPNDAGHSLLGNSLAKFIQCHFFDV